MAQRLKFDYPLVLVAWEDITSDGAVQGSKEDILRSIKPCIRYTPGFYIATTADYVIVATDYDIRDGVPYVGAPSQYPKSVVKGIYTLKLGSILEDA